MEIFWSKKLNAPNEEQVYVFLQRVVNRILQGHARYGKPDRGKKYLTWLERELKAYKKTGNLENLLNIAVCCWLESVEPENPKFHYDQTAGSVTRGRV